MTSSIQRNMCGARLRLSWRGFRARDGCRWPADPGSIRKPGESISKVYGDLPLVVSERFLRRDAACTWRRSYSAEAVHNLRGPERVRGQGARTCWVQAIVASDCVRALVLSGARRPPPARSQVAWQSFRRSVKRSRARRTRLHGPTTARGRACHLVGARAGADPAGSPPRRGAPGCLDGLSRCALPQAAGAG